MSSYQALVNQYCQGEGVFTGKQPSSHHHWIYSKQPDNLYRINSVVPPESADYVLVDKHIFESTKYYPILLKEWFYATKLDGFIVIPVQSQKAVKNINDLVSGFYPERALKVVREEKDETGTTFVIQKIRPALTAGDNIDSWTFGIITKGQRNDLLEQVLKSIRALKVPNYEIVICGTYFDRKEPDFRYIPFSEKDDKGWITKKKNIITENARFENVVIGHDRLLYTPNWHEGMKEYGSYFDALSCEMVIKDTDFRTFDWYMHSYDLKAPPQSWPFFTASRRGIHQSCMGLHYDDWDYRAVMTGSVGIFKRSLLKLVPWNEDYFWNEDEDAELSRRLHKAGALIRFNPYSKLETLRWRHCLLSLAKRNTKELEMKFDPDPGSYKIYNAKFYAKLRWQHFKQRQKTRVRKFCESRNIDWVNKAYQALKK